MNDTFLLEKSKEKNVAMPKLFAAWDDTKPYNPP